MTRPWRVPAGLRWSCSGCAECCTSAYDHGPVAPETIEALTAANIEALWPPAAERPWFVTRAGPDGKPAAFLAHHNGHCVFLRDDRLCAIHAALGPHAKPGFCQEFPYHLVEEPRGWVAVVRPGCAGFHRSSVEGAVVGPELDDIARLPSARPHHRFDPADVPVLPGLSVPVLTWLSWEDELLAALQAAPALGPIAAVATVRDRLHTLAERTHPPADPARARRAVGAIALALQHVLSAALASQTGPPERVRFAHDAIATLDRVTARLSNAPRAADPDLAAYLHLLLRSHLHAKSWRASGSVAEGVGHWLLGVTVALAQPPDDGPVGPDAFASPFRHWLSLAHNPLIGAVLRKARPALLDLFLHTR